MAHAQRELSGSLERSAELVFAARPDAVSVVFQVDDERYQLPASAVGSLRVTTVSLAHTRFENDLSTAHPGEEIELVWQLCDADGTDALQSGWLWTAVLQSQREAGDVGEVLVEVAAVLDAGPVEGLDAGNLLHAHRRLHRARAAAPEALRDFLVEHLGFAETIVDGVLPEQVPDADRLVERSKGQFDFPPHSPS
jgi:hypothetical protein